MLTLCPGATDTEMPARQGIDPAALSHLMSPDDVARQALDQLGRGPAHIPGEHYRATFEALLSMPRTEALTAMAENLRPGP